MPEQGQEQEEQGGQENEEEQDKSVDNSCLQSVLAPGFFTMASNVITSSFKDIHPEMPRCPSLLMSHEAPLLPTTLADPVPCFYLASSLSSSC